VVAAAFLIVVATVSVVLYHPGGESRSSSSATVSAASSSSYVSSSTSVSGTSTSIPLAADLLTYHYDNRRTGELTTASRFSVPAFRWKTAVDGAVYAEPLVYKGSVFVATENDSVYSLSTADGGVIWRTNLGAPLPRSSLPCGDIDPVGITGTPVIDPVTSTLYVVTMLREQGYALFAIATSSGLVEWHTTLHPGGFDYTVQQQRGALSLSGGRIYVPFGGFAGDCGEYHGWVMSFPANDSGSLTTFQVPSTREAGIWSPGGLTVSNTGQIYFTTGNSASASSFDYGNSVIQLNDNMTIASYFAPSNWRSLNAGDTDLGSLPPLDLGNGLLFQAGKEGVGYLLNESALGGIGGQTFSAKVCQSAFGAAALNGSSFVVVPCIDGLFALKVSGGSPSGASFTIGWSRGGFWSGPPIIAYGAIWAVDLNNGTLFAFDGSGRTLFRFSLGGVTHFTTPSAAEGLVLAAAKDNVYAFQVTE
jgi:hypothetical protein